VRVSELVRGRGKAVSDESGCCHERLEKHPSGVKQAAERLRDLSGCEENHPSAAQAGGFLLGLSARINPRPFKTALHLSFAARINLRPFKTAEFSALWKSCPDTRHAARGFVMHCLRSGYLGVDGGAGSFVAQGCVLGAWMPDLRGAAAFAYAPVGFSPGRKLGVRLRPVGY
jgi:hypothetical protein